MFKLTFTSKSQFQPGRVGYVLFTSSCLAMGTAVQAQMSQPPSTSNWTINAGAAIASGPRYPGSGDNKTSLFPVIDARYKDFLFFSPIRGIGVDFPLAQGLSASAAIGFDMTSRKEKESPRLVGLGDVKSTGALLLGLDYRLGDAFAKAGLNSRLGSDNKRGTSLEIDLGYNFIKTQSLVLGAGVNLRTMDNTYARNFFGVDARQSEASNLKAFNAGGGLQSAGAFASGLYRFDNQWSAFGRLNLYQLQGDAADSPITEKKDQTRLVLGVTRTF